MKQPQPLPQAPPFLTIYTNTRLRPEALRRNLESVGRQTAAADLEQLVIPDHVGYGLVNALYGRIAWYAGAARGLYVAVLSDDDALAGETVVAQVKAASERNAHPAILSVRVRKGDQEFPKADPLAPPVEGEVDLGTYIVRRDIWLQHAGDYGMRYAGDYDWACKVFAAGHRVVKTGVLFAEGPTSNGRPELSL